MGIPPPFVDGNRLLACVGNQLFRACQCIGPFLPFFLDVDIVARFVVQRIAKLIQSTHSVLNQFVYGALSFGQYLMEVGDLFLGLLCRGR